MHCFDYVSTLRPYILAAALAICAGGQVRAEVLTMATWDTDSYVFFGTNSVTATEITLGEPVPPGVDPHYNVGFVEFDVAGLSLAGPKYLQVEPNVSTAVLPSTVRVAGLLADTAGYFAAADAAERSFWLAANAYAQPSLATLTISPTGGKHYADVTDIVNHWIGNPADNYGLALWRVGGDGFDSPELYSIDDPGGRGPALNSVPEPGGSILVMAAALSIVGLATRRRHRHRHRHRCVA